jgi:translation elongation factor EF-1alpha
MELEVGKVTHYFNHLHVAVLRLTGELKIGDKIHVTGHATDFTEHVASMQVDHHAVERGKPGDDVAIKVVEPVHEHDVVYQAIEEVPAPYSY